MRKQIICTVVAFIASMICFMACTNDNSLAFNEKGSLSQISNSVNSPPGLDCESITEEHSEMDSVWEQKLYFYSDTGALGVRLLSEGIVAYDSEPVAPSETATTKFGLVDIYEEFPPKTEGTEHYKAGEYRKYDWADYQHRLEKAHYKLKIHKKLEAEVNEIVTRLLQVDYVIPQISISSFEPPIEWSNEEILLNFIKSNCTITYFEGEYTAKDTNGDSTQNPLWRIYQGGCFFDGYTPNKCEFHEFYIWLVDFSGEELVIYDLKYVKEAGCGRTSPLANDNKSNQ